MPIAFLYSGRIGIAALGLIILPWLNKIMPVNEFGLAATVISLQSLAVVLDLGLSITISRELPVTGSANERLSIVKQSERTLLVLYLTLTATAFALSAFGFIPVPVQTVILICLSMFLVVWQNLIVTALTAQQKFITSTISQFFSQFLRLGAALAFVAFYSDTLLGFVLGQVVGSLVILVLSRFILILQNRPDGTVISNRRPRFISNLAIMVYTVAGASALQLDKLLLSGLASPAYTGPYFLASVFSLVPITFLASPLSQFVQPKLIASIALNRHDEARRWIARLTVAIFAMAVLPGIILALGAPIIVPFWLQGSAQEPDVIRYVILLMPGASVGALGLIPAIVLIARCDYRALAFMSCLLTFGVLTMSAMFAARNAINAICLTYSAYHILAAIALWWRAWRIEPNFSNLFDLFTDAAKRRK